MGNSSGDDEDNTIPRPTPIGAAITTSKFKVDEMPRWRFVGKAKKTEGYTSAAAGKVIEGEFKNYNACSLNFVVVDIVL